jgi:uncharacterized protein
MAMLVLLPPSEGKASARRGAPVSLEKLVFPELAELRAALLDAVDPALLGAPAAKASTIYTGVLFGQLKLSSLPAAARRRVLIFSGLWGVVRPDDRIPPYKLPIDALVEGFPALAAYWRSALTELIPDRGLILDLRSGPYATAWRPRDAKVITVRGFTEDANGHRTVISHMVKRIRGDVARAALLASPPPRTPEAVAQLASDAGMLVDLDRDRSSWSLDVIERA